MGTTIGSDPIYHEKGELHAPDEVGVKIIATREWVEENASPAEALPYKVYTALLSQSGTDAPVAVVLQNTLGGTVVWTRDQLGRYFGTLSNAFTEDKTYIPGFFINFSENESYIPVSDGGSINGYYSINRSSASQLTLETVDESFSPIEFSTLFPDDKLSLPEIRVYP